MSTNRVQPPGGCATRPATREPATRRTACQGTATDTSPDDLSMLVDQIADFHRSGLLPRVQYAVDQVLSFMAGHVITTAVAIALLATLVALIA